MDKVQFQNAWMPYLLLAPQMLIIAIFFFWPAAEAIRASFYLEDPFFGNATFVGLQNYRDAFAASDYQRTVWFTVVFTVLVSLFSLFLGLMLAVSADRVLRGQSSYKTLLMWVYAIAPPVAGLIGVMMFDQHIGPLVDFAALFGWEMRVGVNYWDTGFAMIVVSTWKQVPYCFIFFLSGLQSIPTS
ncbi:MAG: sugar ABC transporter permease, partial [Pseudomonadota bacterium]